MAEKQTEALPGFEGIAMDSPIGREALPEPTVAKAGEYELECFKAEMGKSQGGSAMVTMTFRFLEGEHWPIREYVLFFSASDDAEVMQARGRQQQNLMIGFGLMKPSDEFTQGDFVRAVISERFFGARGWWGVKVEAETDEYPAKNRLGSPRPKR